jgi:hypothetical protein
MVPGSTKHTHRGTDAYRQILRTSRPGAAMLPEIREAAMTRRAGVAALILMLLLAGCGGSSDSSDDGGTSGGGGGGGGTRPLPDPAPTEFAQTRGAPVCPDGFRALPGPAGRERTWSACGSADGSDMIVYNLSEATLLVSPDAGTKLATDAPTDLTDPHDQAWQALLDVKDPGPDPQANGARGSVNAGWFYLPPDGAIRATSTTGGASTHISVDVFATARHTIALSVAAYLTGKVTGKVTPKPLAIRQAVTSCVQELKVTADDLESPPPPAFLTQQIVAAGDACYSVIRSLDTTAPPPEELGQVVSKEARSLSKAAFVKMPPEVWADVLRFVGQLAHAR